MTDSRKSGDRTAARRQARAAAPRSTRDGIVHTGAPPAAPAAPSHLTVGDILWTLTHEASTAQARRWLTPSGCELQLLIWTGDRVEGQEDLCWSQLFASEDALIEAAQQKKQQLHASGWLEQIDATAR